MGRDGDENQAWNASSLENVFTITRQHDGIPAFT
jgi:hypothetical protein